MSSFLWEVLRCPKCGGAFRRDGDHIECGRAHRYPVRGGVPRLGEGEWDDSARAVVAATKQAFGDQWVNLGETAEVTAVDLDRHLPRGWDTATLFRGRVLDAGCGMGRYTRLVARLGCDAIGIDVSHAVEKAAQLWPEVPFVQGDLVAPPFAAGTFDVVYSFGVLHHLPDPLRGWRACFDLVKPGGTLVGWLYSEHGGLLRAGRKAARRIVNKVPALVRPVAAAAAASIWGGYLLPARALGRPIRKLAFYSDKSFGQLYVDCHDAIAAPAEVYLSERDCKTWIDSIATTDAGFERRNDSSGWIVWARK